MILIHFSRFTHARKVLCLLGGGLIAGGRISCTGFVVQQTTPTKIAEAKPCLARKQACPLGRSVRKIDKTCGGTSRSVGSPLWGFSRWMWIKTVLGSICNFARKGSNGVKPMAISYVVRLGLSPRSTALKAFERGAGFGRVQIWLPSLPS